MPKTRREGSGEALIVRGASAHNLKQLTVAFPLGTMICVTGVSGSGKSTLVNEILAKRLAHDLHRARERPGAHAGISGLAHVDKAVVIDQSPIGRTPRSNPATYTGLFTVVRELFATVPEARARGYKPGRFLIQRQGRALRGLQGRRLQPDRDAVPARRDGALRGLPGRPLQPRSPRNPLPRPHHRRGAAHDRDRGARVLRRLPAREAQAGDAARRRARLHPTRPAGDHALRRRGAAREARDGALEARHRPHGLHPRRAGPRASPSRTSRRC